MLLNAGDFRRWPVGANSGAERDFGRLWDDAHAAHVNPWRGEHKERKPVLSVEHPSAWLGPSKWKQLACGMWHVAQTARRALGVSSPELGSEENVC